MTTELNNLQNALDAAQSNSDLISDALVAAREAFDELGDMDEELERWREAAGDDDPDELENSLLLLEDYREAADYDDPADVEAALNQLAAFNDIGMDPEEVAVLKNERDELHELVRQMNPTIMLERLRKLQGIINALVQQHESVATTIKR